VLSKARLAKELPKGRRRRIAYSLARLAEVAVERTLGRREL
jgi:hypothetical protein